MISFYRLKDVKCEQYSYMLQLLTSAFPSDEYRDLDELARFVMSNEDFNACIILQNQMPIGILNYWNGPSFCYIEHFAIDQKARNQGVGGCCLQRFLQESKHAVVLEAELPTDELSARRIGFYKRNGFDVRPEPYVQPSYKAGASTLPMHILASGSIDFNIVKDWLYKTVYHTNTM